MPRHLACGGGVGAVYDAGKTGVPSDLQMVADGLGHGAPHKCGHLMDAQRTVRRRNRSGFARHAVVHRKRHRRIVLDAAVRAMDVETVNAARRRADRQSHGAASRHNNVRGLEVRRAASRKADRREADGSTVAIAVIYLDGGAGCTRHAYFERLRRSGNRIIRSQDRPQYEQPLPHPADHHHAAGVIGVVAPGPVERCTVVRGIDVEKSLQHQRTADRLAETVDFQAAGVIGLVRITLVYIEVVVDGGVGAVMETDQDGVIQIANIPDSGAGVVTKAGLVQLIILQQVGLVLRKPALVGITATAVRRSGKLLRISLITHVHHRDRVFVVCEADFTALMVGVGSSVVHALGVMGVAVCTEAAGVCGRQGILNVDKMQPARTGACADGIGITAVLIDHDVVSAAKAGEMGVLTERHRRVGDRPQAGQVKHLHPVRPRLADDKSMIGVNLDIPPAGTRTVGREISQVDRVLRIRDVDKGGARRAAHDCILFSVLRVRPAPDVIPAAPANGGERQECQQVHVVAGIRAGKSCNTGGQPHRFQLAARFEPCLDIGLHAGHQRCSARLGVRLIFLRDCERYVQQ